MDTRTYELMFIASAQLGDTELETLLQRVQRYLEAAEAEVLSFKEWGLRRLAYPILKQREGRYYLVHFRGSPQSINPLDRNLRLIEGLMRHIIVRIEDVQAHFDEEETTPVTEAQAPQEAASEEAEPEAVTPEEAAPEQVTSEETASEATVPGEAEEEAPEQDAADQASE